MNIHSYIDTLLAPFFFCLIQLWRKTPVLKVLKLHQLFSNSDLCLLLGRSSTLWFCAVYFIIEIKLALYCFIFLYRLLWGLGVTPHLSVYRSINDGDQPRFISHTVVTALVPLPPAPIFLLSCRNSSLESTSQNSKAASVSLLDTRGGLEQESVCLFLKPPRFSPPSPCSRESWSEGMTEMWPEFMTWSSSFHCRLL